MAYTEKINLRINVKDIDKDAIYKGKKGDWLDLTVIPKASEWSDYMVVQYRGKDLDNVIVGNGKDFIWNNNSNADSDLPPVKLDESSEDGLPF